MSDISLNESDEVTIADSGGVNKLTVNSDGTVNSRLYDSNGSGVPKGQATKANSIPVTLASDQEVLTVTISNDEQVRFSVVVSNFNLTLSGVEQPILLIKNPSGSGKNLRVQLLGMNNRTKTQSALFFAYANPTVVANGTGLTARYLKVGDSTTSVMNLYSGPTVSANGTVLHSYGTGANQNDLTRLVDATDSLLENNMYLITGIGSNNNTNIDLSFEWTED